MSWQDAVLPTEATLQDAIACLNYTGLQIVLVCGTDRVLAGTLTDGDIRRGLIRGLTLDSPVNSLFKPDPLVVPPEMGGETVLQLMRANGFGAIPVVDAARRVVGLHLLNRLLTPNRRSNLMVIMAGGKGTRLLPHTQDCPKPLLPINGKPMLEHIIERARAEGFQRFVIAVHYLAGMIETYFGDGSRWNVRIDYLREEAPLGTAGALGLLQPRPAEAFVVSNGDVLTDIRYGELLDFHLRNGAAATMAVRMHEWQHPFGVVRTDGVDIVGFEEKPISRSHINAGIYVLEPRALDTLSGKENCDMPTLFTRLQERAARTIVYPMHEPWLDVGRAADLERARSQTTPRPAT
ncbi:MAG: nucleotidyltransferase family protein [Proteobacteria bacterium]|nr:nucleotidyltransferase family protein [Pseudomonadota bacterium]